MTSRISAFVRSGARPGMRPGRDAGWATAVRAVAVGAVVTVVLCLALAASAGAQEVAAGPLNETSKVVGASVSSIVILFVLAILIESALAVIFNWRLFLEMFNGRGVKTLVAIIVSWLVVDTFKIDQYVFKELLANYGIPTDPKDRTIAIIITTLILAGGSGGVNRVLVSLGYREPIADKPKVQKAPKGKAWVAIRFTRDKAVGPIEVHIQKLAARTDASPPELAGVVNPVGFWYRLWSVFFLDRNRYPPAGGHDVEPGFEYRIAIDAKDADGNPVPSGLEDKYCFADGAIIDFHVTL